MTGNDATNDNSPWRNHLYEYFGAHLAAKALEHYEVIHPNDVEYISERCIYPDIVPIYRELRKTRLTVGNWSDIFIALLRCKSVPDDKIQIVYRQIYTTLTGTKISDTLFYALPADEKQFWIRHYVKDDSIVGDSKKFDEYCKNATDQFGVGSLGPTLVGVGGGTHRSLLEGCT